jgi:Tfp pilus assembly protein PilN
MNVETLNLLPPGRRTMLRLQRRLHVWTLIAAGYGVATLGACITLAAGEPQVDRRETKELAAITQAIDSLKELDAQHKKDIAKEVLRKQGSDLVSDHPDWSILLNLLADQRGSDAVIESVEVSPVPQVPHETPTKSKIKGQGASSERPAAYDVKLVGFARTQTDVTDFADRLQKSGTFDSVALTRSGVRVTDKSQVVEYLIQCRLGESAPVTIKERTP